MQILKKFKYKNEIIIFFILFLASTSIVIFQFLEWENSEEKIKHNALALYTGDEPFYLEIVSSITRFQSLSTSAHFTSLEKDPFLELAPIFYEVNSCRLHHSLTASDGDVLLAKDIADLANNGLGLSCPSNNLITGAVIGALGPTKTWVPIAGILAIVFVVITHLRRKSSRVVDSRFKALSPIHLKKRPIPGSCSKSRCPKA